MPPPKRRPARAPLRIGQGIIAFTTAVLGLTLSAQTLGDLPPEGTARLSMAGLSLILLGAGAFLGRVAPNRLVGVRTPWSYKSRLAWDRSNRLAGRLLFILGLAGLFVAPWGAAARRDTLPDRRRLDRRRSIDLRKLARLARRSEPPALLIRPQGDRPC
ncbi:SdpI family protein [Brevundimonas sp.]|uniref:SdpI family protein n=1 Tax=Brevundimonas sp. TaxID=1871086 RepID=UPI003BA9CB65